jgi:hypothetical protein
VASYPLYLFLVKTYDQEALPVGMKICYSCMKRTYQLMKQSTVQSIPVDDTWHPDCNPPSPKRRREMETFNEALTSLEIAPLKSTLQHEFDEVSERHQRRLRNEFKSVIEQITEKYATATASTMSTKEFTEKIAIPVFQVLSVRGSLSPVEGNSQEFQRLVNLYHQADKKTKIQLLTLVADDNSKSFLISQFGCSKRDVDTARLMNHQQKTLTKPVRKPAFSPRITDAKVHHFLDYLFRNNLLQDNANFTHKITLSNGQVIEIPQVLMVVKKRQMVYSYL